MSIAILLFGYAVDRGSVHVIDLAGGEILPPAILAALTDPNIVKTAFNAAFERICLSSWLRQHAPDMLHDDRFLDPSQWRCPMVWAAYLGLPMSLEVAAQVLSLTVHKDAAGKKLIKQFCAPAGPTMFNEGAAFDPPALDPQAWQRFKDYNQRDVEVELAIQDRLSSFPMPEAEWEAYALDQRINDRGVALDRQLVDNAVRCAAGHHDKSVARAQALTGLANPNSPLQLKEWLITKGCDIGVLRNKRYLGRWRYLWEMCEKS